MSVNFGFSLPALRQYGAAGSNPFGQLGPTLDLSFVDGATGVTDLSNPTGYTLNTNFITPEYQVAAQYAVWNTTTGLTQQNFADIVTFSRTTGATWFNAAGNLVGVDFSVTSVTIGTGSKTFTLDATAGVNRSWAVGDSVLISQQSNSANNMIGTVTSYTASTQVLVVNVTSTGGSGTITSWRVSSLMPRFDYNPSTLAAQGLLIEESRQNLLLQSGWAGATSGSPGTAPTSWTLGFGTGTVTTVVASTTGPIANAVRFDYDNTERVYFDQAITVTSGTQYAFSIYVEALSGAVAGDVLYVVTGTTSATINTFVTNPSATGRYTLLFTANGNGTVNLRAGAGTSAAVLGTGSITLSRPQCEAGAFPTSYIPTTVAAATRSEDRASINTMSPWYNASASTIYAEHFRPLPTPAGSFPRAVDFISTATSDKLGINHVDNRLTVSSQDIYPSGLSWPFTSVNANANNVIKHAIAATVGSGRYAVNGTLGGSDYAIPSIPTLDQVVIGSGKGFFGISTLNGWVRRVTYYPRRLSNADLQAITA